MDDQLARKPRVLCFHGFRLSGKIFEEQTEVWPEFVREKMDLVFVDAPFLAEGGLEELGAEELFDPPLYEWFQAKGVFPDLSEFRNFDECIAFVEDCMTRIGPFDGLMGFSQGAFLSAALPGMQAEVLIDHSTTIETKMEHQLVRKPRVLCLHAFRISGKIFEKQTEVWPEFVREKMDLVFIDAPFPAEGGSGVQGEFDPPYYEWFQFNQDFSEHRNFDECIAYIEDCMIRMGPVDGFLGFSQMEEQPVRKPRVLCLHAFRTSGKIFEKQTEVWPEFVREKMDLVFIDAPFPAEGGSGVQGKFDPPYYEWFQFNQGVALTSVPMIKFVMLMSGSKFGGSMFSSPRLAKNAFSSPIQCPSLHFLAIEKKMDGQQLARKPRVLCFHGFRTSGKIFEEQTQVWPEFVREKMDLVFIDAPFPAEGGLEELGVAAELFDPPLYEWFQANKDFSEYRNFDECIAFVEDCMTRIGPFDGLMGFSQGAFLAAALPGMQAEVLIDHSTTIEKKMEHQLVRKPRVLCLHAFRISGKIFEKQTEVWPEFVREKMDLVFIDAPFPAEGESGVQGEFDPPYYEWFQFNQGVVLTSVPKIKFVMLICGGEKDFGLTNGIELLDSFVDPVVINHPGGHEVPKLDEKGSETMIKFIEKVQELL
ncbi:hypothetical protein RHGRI_030075 [Rhododendron griersonianum]|uniref:Serine hydrolase domain-containing protein n=1 Tax=Rhododendron griersonianum TaxID=479676 RepID=A0AAV6IS13_9ERIC|nr:hypothetical protein RHGRI_030075 [Rhododendron griersonianum]